MTTTLDVTLLACDFSEVLGQWLTPEELDAVNARNAVEQSPSVCHSHDFCDANMAMLEACERQNPLFDLTEDADVTAWNAAWDLARACEFLPSRIRATDTR